MNQHIDRKHQRVRRSRARFIHEPFRNGSARKPRTDAPVLELNSSKLIGEA
jgi:hypothetical protein